MQAQLETASNDEDAARSYIYHCLKIAQLKTTWNLIFWLYRREAKAEINLDKKRQRDAQARVDASREKVQAVIDNFVKACKEGHTQEVRTHHSFN